MLYTLMCYIIVKTITDEKSENLMINSSIIPLHQAIHVQGKK